MSGDLDGDGFDDVVLTRRTDDGEARWLRGSAAGLDLRAAEVWRGARDEQQSAASILPDLDGDGADELVLGASGAMVDGQEHAGLLRILPGTPTGPTGEPTHVVRATTGYCSFGGDLLSAGDVDGDGVPDLVVPSPSARGPAGARFGAVFLMPGARSWVE